MDKTLYDDIIKILHEELLPAMGCTEPIAVAYAAAVARHALGAVPDRVEITVSGNILKNVKSVIVPSTGGLKGVTSAAAAGIVAGREDRQLEVLSDVTTQDIAEIKRYMEVTPFTVKSSKTNCVFDIGIRVFSGENQAYARIEGHHTNLIEVSKNNNTLLKQEASKESSDCGLTDRSRLTVRNILEFAETVDIKDIQSVIERQITYNTAIAEEGLSGDYGARVGKILLKSFGDSVHNRAKATAAAGSDARMNGCALPVVIVSGSGNQGITASLPVVVYAKELGVSKEKLLRAVVLSDLITIHLKTGIGRLSAYCGAVSAGAGAGAGIAYLHGGGFDEIAHTIVNALAITSGLICDGAKSSCAAKIASAVDAGIFGYEMYKNGSAFCGGDGILMHSVEDTIENVSDLARIGMKGTDEEIIKLMIKEMD
ncbi:MAG: L-serine ammonia-lyase, iron-sulfur-dependent, subunit alpha [Clostridia bacterium]|nr:L-serine ammonia-lyase, iron-sulfur-dependent, subunit alpha [Clostridia bacterium]